MDYREILKLNNQEHLIEYIDNANEEDKIKLINQVKEIDFNELNKLYKLSTNDKAKEFINRNIEKIAYTDEYNMPTEKFDKLKEIGEEIIKNNQYAVVTMAGGQGSRLDFNGPKGTFLLEVQPKPKYLFEIICDGIKEANKKYNIILNWYIMTSTENNKDTVDFFEEHNYFDYPKENVKFFIQGNTPILDENGKLLVDKRHNIRIAADGNGCIYKAMRENGVLKELRDKNIKWIFIGSVDNVLLNMCDPILLGLTISENNLIASKSIIKRNPQERVGVFCKIDGKPSVIEYSELPTEMAERTTESGELEFAESHIMCNLYNIEALEKISLQDLPYHSAHKRISYIDKDSNYIIPEKENAYKYETFIFDGFNYFENISILRGKRENDFAPIKNKEGESSPETAIKLYNDFHKFN